ncbi:MAG: TerC family protein [Betaproteobacteria bacterium]|nr:TerC family protein [Betaproteobacteria bacterium]
MEALLSTEILMSLLTLTVMEIVLGIDNVIFISLLAGRLPKEQRDKARVWGLGLAAVMRIGLLFGITWLASLTQPLFRFMDKDVSVKSLILLTGGLFLLYKSTKEIHHKIEAASDIGSSAKIQMTLAAVLVQIILIDLVFSIDSIITAIGMTQNTLIMIVANVVALGLMMIFGKSIGDFVEKHPSIKMLALSFLLMIGLLLVAEGFSYEFPKGYLYFAMAFSVVVEMLNLRAGARSKSSQPQIHHSDSPQLSKE